MTSSYVRWRDVRAAQIERAGGEQAVEAGKQELLATVVGHRLAEVRRARGLTQQQVAERMGVTKGRVSQIEQGKISGQDVLARYARAHAGRVAKSTDNCTNPPQHAQLFRIASHSPATNQGPFRARPQPQK